MRTLNLKLQGGIRLNPVVKIDDGIIDYKRNKYEAVQITHQTEKQSVDIEIFNLLEIKGPYWWLVQMLFYLITFFGIFNPKLEKNCFIISYKAKINLVDGENNVLIKINKLEDGGKALTVESNLVITEEQNTCILDRQAQKRRKILKLSYILAWVMLAVIAIVLIVCLK